MVNFCIRERREDIREMSPHVIHMVIMSSSVGAFWQYTRTREEKTKKTFHDGTILFTPEEYATPLNCNTYKETKYN